MIERLLIANRGEIAVRVARTAKRMGIHVIAVYSDTDAAAMHVAVADEAVRIGPDAAAESYLNIDAVIAAARETRADAIHPGYGFLSENADFADACVAAEIRLVGPSADAMRAMGDKAASKEVMSKADVPLVPGYHGADQDPAMLAKQAAEIGFPVLIKASAGGGGRGMRIVESADAFDEALAAAQREARGAFGNDRVLIEKYLTTPRHIEVQVFGDDHGNVVHLFERDCSLQRRYQKVVEEAPAPGMRDERRAEIGAAAVAAARAIDYSGAGTVEFIVDATTDGANGPFYFMEMNTRLQVEHPVTEFITGLDLVEWQLLVANGEALPLEQGDISLKGHAIEARLYAEDPDRDFLPAPGHVVAFEVPEMGASVRIDTGVATGDDIAVSYDPMIAKVIAHGADRDGAIAALDGLLAALVCAGPVTNQAFLRRAITHPDFVCGAVDTGFIDRHRDALIPLRDGVPDGALAAVVARLLAQRARQAGDQASARGEANSPWAASDSWRANLQNAETLLFRDGESEVSVCVVHDADRVSLTLSGGQSVDLETGCDGWSAFVLGNIYFAVAAGSQIRLERIVAVDEASDRAGASGGLNAPMPGKVVRVMVAADEQVSRGQTLMVLEAMKMEHAITAPGDGKVAAVFFAEGDQVAEGAELLQLEPVED
ncbi:MAG: ATP-grasp domain-containing protein [Rhodospirillaceae bacterium]|jgi:3-methylcrotonyl-CoA carboxylase alpha subunit|nr:ATP-grasp domain-containing protein [Rhodospirillaceae bacterium]MBT5944635.1 ATP-grasp domain-containing protein [Rhodospirillaceae bacterium]MBT6404668.1 ATP-grasp domain-containing protein [Rhodospirillaceae bacterium]MBT6535583.1 ATP-grasp domain-containing protein [Rhodospirillaceae bacterium]MBT7360971.1 ATP-grasp domain-containing protein [Rhodospirillaceae bacterium]